jgi:NAD(P)-dependent dehydrogenase (short-subunit alcohol dehydrogenase family)
MIDFTGQRAIVTGGASGIGAATAALLKKYGCEVFIIDRETDVTHRPALEQAIHRSAPFDIVIANAGIAEQADLHATSEDLWNRTVAVNLTGVFHTVQIASRYLKAQRSGSIVLTASTNSFDGEPRLTAYNATKAGVLGLLHTCANELGPYGVRVNAVCPGLIRTPLTQAAFNAPKSLKTYFQNIPLGRGGEAPEVANAIAFLASDLASYVTGATLLVDGGQMASKFGTWTEEMGVYEGGRWRLK